MVLYYVLFIIVALSLAAFAMYFLYQLRIKKTSGKTLSDVIAELEATKSTLDDELNVAMVKLDDIHSDIKKNLEVKQHLIDLEENENAIRRSLQESESTLEEIRRTISELEQKKQELEDDITDIKTDLSLYSPIYNFIEIGFYEEPTYIYEISERYKIEIKNVRMIQKELISTGKAISIPDSVALIENNQYAKKILDGQAHLMLKTFNIECDLLIGAVKPSTYSQTLERIEKVANELEKYSISLTAYITEEYIKLKYDECTLQYQYQLKREREQEEQLRIKEQMREEQKAIREYERALAKAQKEEQLFQDALEVARAELASSADESRARLEEKVRRLEEMLKEAQEKERRAKSMAEQTRRGYIYVISNIGSFGDNIYKIGVTRRLEPLDRVRELGDASVPFLFDVHAMIFSEDAPALEATLHKKFHKHRVNQVNYRKEFFNVSLEDIRNAAISIHGKEIDFKMTALAEQYRESCRLRGLYQ